MGSDARTYLFIEAGWRAIKGDVDEIALSKRLDTVVTSWSIDSTVDQIWIRAWRSGRPVRELRHDDGRWHVSGKPQPFENAEQLGRWLSKSGLIANADGYDVLDSFLGRPASGEVDAASLADLKAATRKPKPDVDRARQQLNAGFAKKVKTVRPLVVVEAAAKAKALQKVLGRTAKVVSTDGPWLELPSDLGIDLEGDMSLLYDLTRPELLETMRAAMKRCNELWLMTDPGAVGETLAGQLALRLTPSAPVRRMPLSSTTAGSVKSARAAARPIDWSLIDAEEARRALARLFSATISRLLWRKIGVGVSAGITTFPAVRRLVARELLRRDGPDETPRYTEATLEAELAPLGLAEPGWQRAVYASVRRGELVPTWLAFLVLDFGDKHLASLAADAFFIEALRDVGAVGTGEQRREDVVRRWRARIDELARSAEPAPPKAGMVLLRDPSGEILLKPGLRAPFIIRGAKSATLPPDLEPDALTLERANALLT